MTVQSPEHRRREREECGAEEPQAALAREMPEQAECEQRLEQEAEQDPRALVLEERG